jgi:predicted DNA repair protein MutK
MRFLRSWKIRILLFFAVVGPGFITANVDNDANGIVTYSQAGAQFGYQLLWTMIPVTLALIVVGNFARMGAVTGKGLTTDSRRVRPRHLLHDARHPDHQLRQHSREFAGIAGSLGCSASPVIHRPVCAVIVWLIVVKRPIQA